MGAFLNRPIDMEARFSENSDHKLRVLIYSDRSSFNPVPFWEALKKQDDQDVLDLDFIPRKTAEADVVVYFLTSWKNYQKMPERTLYEGGFRELSSTDPTLFYQEYRSRIKQFNRDTHIMIFNRGAGKPDVVPPVCFAGALLQSVTDWSVPFDFKNCIENNAP